LGIRGAGHGEIRARERKYRVNDSSISIELASLEAFHVAAAVKAKIVELQTLQVIHWTDLGAFAVAVWDRRMPWLCSGDSNEVDRSRRDWLERERHGCIDGQGRDASAAKEVGNELGTNAGNQVAVAGSVSLAFRLVVTPL
jgi:hypothetical protein